MKDSSPFELPKSHEKLSYKFILDEIKKREIETEQVALAEHLESVTREEPVDSSSEPQIQVPELELPPGQKYFRIGEVADKVRVEPYVLRYWEGEFRSVRPSKSKSGHRVYSANDVRTFHLIRHLLQVEKFSVKGAKKKIQELRRQRPAPAHVEASSRHRETLKQLLTELKQLAQIAKTNPGSS